MKVTDPDVIRIGEMELINAVKDDLNWDAVRKIVTDRLNLSSMESKGGEIVVHNNQVAFRIDLELNMLVSLIFDRDGNYISEKESVASSNVKETAPEVAVTENENVAVAYGEAGGNSEYEEDEPEQEVWDLSDKDLDAEFADVEKDKKNLKNDNELLAAGDELQLKEDDLLSAGDELQLREDDLLSAGDELQLREDDLLSAGDELQLKEDDLLSAGDELQLKEDDLLSAGDELQLREDDFLSAGDELQLKEDDLLSAGDELQLKEDDFLSAGDELQLNEDDFLSAGDNFKIEEDELLVDKEHPHTEADDSLNKNFNAIFKDNQDFWESKKS